MLYFSFLFYKRKNYSVLSLVVWSALWIVALLLIAFPAVLTPVTSSLHFGRTFDLYVALAVMFFALITFFNHTRVSKYERKVEELVRAVAIREVKEPKKRK
jgi:hypothetical protein